MNSLREVKIVLTSRSYRLDMVSFNSKTQNFPRAFLISKYRAELLF